MRAPPTFGTRQAGRAPPFSVESSSGGGPEQARSSRSAATTTTTAATTTSADSKARFRPAGTSERTQREDRDAHVHADDKGPEHSGRCPAPAAGRCVGVQPSVSDVCTHPRTA